MGLTVLLAEHTGLTRHGLEAIVEPNGIEIVAVARDNAELVDLARTLRPDCVVLGASTPEGAGVEAARSLARSGGTARAIVVGSVATGKVAAAFRDGVRGFVAKECVVPDLVRAIREVAAGGVFLSPAASRTIVEAYLDGDSQAYRAGGRDA